MSEATEASTTGPGTGCSSLIDLREPTVVGCLLSIGEVLAELREEFPHVTISKIRFLEAEGLVQPERTASGYRKFSDHDVSRLRYVLGAQQRHYLPLRVIREHLDALDRGLEPPPLIDVTPQVPHRPATTPSAVPAAAPDVRVSRAEVIAEAGIPSALLDELEEHGLVQPLVEQGGPPTYSLDSLDVVRIVGEMSRFGIEARHLRGVRTAAQREAGLIEQAVRHLRRAGDGSSEAVEAATRLADLAARLHGVLLAAALQSSSVVGR